jgi:heme exporter protein D
MPDLGPHAGFILAAYGVTLIAVSTLVLAIVADDRHQRHVLAELEKKGIRRRSAKPETTSAPRASPSRKRSTAKTRKRSA